MDKSLYWRVSYYGKLEFVDLVIQGFFLVIFMYNLATTADSYLSPTLEQITLKFKLSESLAGVTLLAFGNGAPDVFSAISASQGTRPTGQNSIDLGNA